MRDNSTSEIDTAYGKKLKVTCIERKYMVIDSKVSFIIVAKKELDEDTTEKMLHEDMELKTFLANYEIANIKYISDIEPSYAIENIKIQKKKMPEIGKKEESEAVKKRRDIIMNTLKRRELFDSLDLPEEFLVRDYIEVIEKNGIKISNTAMPYDDLKWLTKTGKVKMLKKTERGVTIYKKIKKAGTDDEKESQESQSDENQSNKYSDKALLPSKNSINRYIGG